MTKKEIKKLKKMRVSELQHVLETIENNIRSQVEKVKQNRNSENYCELYRLQENYNTVSNILGDRMLKLGMLK